MKRTAGAYRLGRLIGLDSLDRNLVNEDRQVATNIDRLESWLEDGDTSSLSSEASESDEMRILAGGDVVIHPASRPDAKEPLPVATQKQQSNLLTKVLPYVFAALVGGAIPTAALFLTDYLKKSPEVVQPTDQPDTSTSIEIGGGEPTLKW
jgi:hypothetical protein